MAMEQLENPLQRFMAKLNADKQRPVQEKRVGNKAQCPFCGIQDCMNCHDWVETKENVRTKYLTGECRHTQVHLKMLKESGLSGKDVYETFQRAVIDKDNRTFYTYLQNEWDRKKWLYIQSKDNGTGKSYTANAIANMLMSEEIQPLVKREVDMEKDLKDSFKDDTGFSEYRIVNKWRLVQVLIIQDIGKVGTRSEWWPGQLYDLIDYRLIHGKTTIFTSNFDVENERLFIQRYGENHGTAIYSRLNGMCEIWDMSGADRRLLSAG